MNPNLQQKDKMLLRLHVFLARAGIASRRAAEKMILQGRVAVNRKVIRELGFKIQPGEDQVEVDGEKIREKEKKVYYILNKPQGVLSTLRDPGGRKVIRHLLVGIPQRVFPVGRLDYDAQGLVLMTNDGELAYRILHPKFQVERTYQVKVRGIPQEKDLEPLRKGLKIRGESFAPAKVHLLKNTDLSTWLVATLFEGRNREIKRMFEFIGFPVQRLTRTRFGPLKLGTLRSGTWRPLKGEEKRALLTLR